ncbi:MAG: hypothetical protein C0413_04840 [Clostridiales bacterium]|nr:hypothetical protein [Clostridiales bacterium]
MKEWDVVGVIATLIALISAVIAPMIKLTQAIARLTATMEQLEKSADCFAANNRNAHERIWEHAREQAVQISDHEARIRVMEET